MDIMASSGGPPPEMNAAYENVVISEPPIFPSLIWDLILEMLDNAKDVSNIVQAIPQLAPLVRKKAHKLRFGEVIPCLIDYVNRTELLDCRLVSTKWSRNLEQFLGSHPDLVHNGWIPLGAKLNEDEMEEDTDRINGFFGVRELSTREMIDKFLEDMEGHPRNPFLGRKLRLVPDLPFPHIMNAMALGRFWEGADQLLQKFGEHVWDLQLDFPRVVQNPAAFSQPILRCFRHLPNLKHFTFGNELDTTWFTDPPNSRNFRYGAARAVNDFIQSGTPPPPMTPNLESFEIYLRNCPPPLFNFLLAWFSATLRKLTLHRPDDPKRGLPRLRFPILVDLSIKDSTPRKALLRLLQSLDAPQVSKLELSLMAPDTEYAMALHLFPFLKKMSKLRSLTLKCSGLRSWINEEDWMSPDLLSMPSVKSLKISSNCPNLSYNFLLCFPSLEELEIVDKRPPPEEEQNCSRPGSTMRLAKYLRPGRIYMSNVWGLLPNLKELTVKSSGSSPRRYTRADKDSYDKLFSGCRYDAFGY